MRTIRNCDNIRLMSLETDFDQLIENVTAMAQRLATTERMTHFHKAWLQTLETYVVTQEGKELGASAEERLAMLREMKKKAYALHIESLQAVDPRLAATLDVRNHMLDDQQEEWFGVEFPELNEGDSPKKG